MQSCAVIIQNLLYHLSQSHLQIMLCSMDFLLHTGQFLLNHTPLKIPAVPQESVQEY